MKKPNITLITLEILLIILVVSNSIFNISSNDVRKELKENEIASLNQILKYKLPAFLNFSPVLSIFENFPPVLFSKFSIVKTFELSSNA